MLPARLAPARKTRVVAAVSPARRVQQAQRVQPPSTVSRPRVRAKSRFLAALLEWIFPGFGLMYAGSPWKGALVLFGTFIATGAALLYAIGSAPTMHFEDAVNFFVWLFLAHLVWLCMRVIWAWRIAGRNTRLARLSVA
jgi:hypothetical protein